MGARDGQSINATTVEMLEGLTRPDSGSIEALGLDVLRQAAALKERIGVQLQTAALYPLPWEWTTRWGLRRFGFHGLSVSYAIGHARELLAGTPQRAVVCHLGAGCSVTAVGDGRSVSTSMGFTPLEGVMMAQRSGSVDPGLLLYLMTRRGMAAEELERGLNERSGLLGVSGVSADLRQVLAAAEAGQERAVLARDMFVQRVVSGISRSFAPGWIIYGGR